MIQELFSIGSFSVSPFGVMLVLALLASYFQLRNGLVRLGIGDEEDASTIVFFCGLFGILGGKLYYAVLIGDLTMLYNRAGIVWYGSLIAGAVAFILTVRSRKIPLAGAFDAAAPALPLGYAVGRMGCFLVGDDYGVPTDLPWGVVFENGLPPTTAGILRRHFGVELDAGVPDSALIAVHPTQLYTVAASLVIFALALRLSKIVKFKPGGLFMLVMIAMSIERFMVEFVRAKDDRFFGTFTLAQLISVGIILLVGALAVRHGIRAEEA
ncbi:MAG: prolipoprotein diacylglyceryl transferase family protein [Acidobacteriota bacterium]